MRDILLKPGREKPIISGHPWVFSGAIAQVNGTGQQGDFCRVLSADKRVLGHGCYNSDSSINVRMLTKGDVPFTPAILNERLENAIRARAMILGDSTNSCRLVNAEGDFLPGLIVDRYANGLCVQILTCGMERLRGAIISALIELVKPSFVFERSDTDARRREGLVPGEGLLAGDFGGPVVIKENGIMIGVDVAGGQKTGYYFDQRDNRLLARRYATGRHCCDCFSYSGTFGLNMLAAGAASVTLVDSSKPAIAWGKKNAERNGFDVSKIDGRAGDVFEFLRATDRPFECVVLDPPKFAPQKSDVDRAARGYKDINLSAMKMIQPNGILFSFSCSNAIDVRLFRQIIFGAAADAQRQVQVLHVLGAGPDHPVNLSHQEGEYLKGLALRVC